jgi:hypothetical protein
MDAYKTETIEENMEHIDTNEIRDYLKRAPKKRWTFDGRRMVNTTHVRLKWLSSIAIGTIDARINRRAGITDHWRPFHNPVWKSIERNRRRMLSFK